MKNTDVIASTRMHVLLVILGIIVLIHAVVILCVWLPHRKAAAAAAAPPSAEESAAAVPSSPALPPAAGPVVPQAEAPAADRVQLNAASRTRRYRKPLGVSWIGKPLRYKSAVRGNLPYMPGGTAVGSGILVDLTTRNVLWAKLERKPVPIASMTKMMTLLVAMENLEKHPEWNLDMPVRISRETMRQVKREGVIWLDMHETLPLRSLLQAVAIKSANDAAYQVALTTGGDAASFVMQMNARAAELGMAGTNFVNPHGLPNRDGRHSVSSAEGMVLLGERLLEYPDVMGWAGTQLTFIDRPMVSGGKTELRNTNRLIVPRYPGVDGLKTGYTRAAGFCLTFTAVRNGRRLMGCVTGFPTAKEERDPFARRMLDWGYLRAAEMDAGKITPPPPEKVYLPGSRPGKKSVSAKKAAAQKAAASKAAAKKTKKR